MSLPAFSLVNLAKMSKGSALLGLFPSVLGTHTMNEAFWCQRRYPHQQGGRAMEPRFISVPKRQQAAVRSLEEYVALVGEAAQRKGIKGPVSWRYPDHLLPLLAPPPGVNEESAVTLAETSQDVGLAGAAVGLAAFSRCGQSAQRDDANEQDHHDFCRSGAESLTRRGVVGRVFAIVAGLGTFLALGPREADAACNCACVVFSGCRVVSACSQWGDNLVGVYDRYCRTPDYACTPQYCSSFTNCNLCL